MRAVVIYGAGGFAREVAWLVEQIAEAGEDVRAVAFVDDDPSRHDTWLNGLPVVALDEAARRWPGAGYVAAVGSPAVRRRLVGRADAAGLVAATLIHPRVERSRFVEVGAGTVICAGNVLTTNIRLGRHVQVNLDCTIGHDAVLEDFATLAPGVHVSGWVRLEEGVYVGTGASLINGTESDPLVVGPGATIGAGACVVRSVPPGVTAVGVPAKARG